jgi:hypothetical protein
MMLAAVKSLAAADVMLRPEASRSTLGVLVAKVMTSGLCLAR